MKGVICIIGVTLVAVLVSAVRDYHDLPPGAYCARRRDGCCRDRDDKCSFPILGTLCYCDEFCDRNRTEDCCPDFWSHCRGIAPPQEFSCIYKNKYLPYSSVNKPIIKDNCNECTCEKMGNTVETVCTQHQCMIDEEIIKMVNMDERILGWHARNYSEFWGKTLKEGVTFKLGTKHPNRSVLYMEPIKKIYDPTKLPRRFESEEKWPRKLSPIKDQGWCGSSWAISTVDVASDRLAIMSNGSELIQMSSQQLLSCNNRGQQSCHGGYLDRAWLYLRKYGVVDEDCYPYTGKETKCKIPKKTKFISQHCDEIPEHTWRKELYKSSPAYRLGNETDIMYEIIKNGPVQATMKVHQDFFMYEGGVYKHSGLSKDEYNYDDITRNYHSVRIVGWGEDNSYSPPLKYWRVANSWGFDWGENGYFRIVRGKNECDIEKFVLGAWAKPSVLTDNEVIPELEKRAFINYPRRKPHHKKYRY